MQTQLAARAAATGRQHTGGTDGTSAAAGPAAGWMVRGRALCASDLASSIARSLNS
jgi:hypothetical protein